MYMTNFHPLLTKFKLVTVESGHIQKTLAGVFGPVYTILTGNLTDGENGYGVAIYLMMVQTPLLAVFVCGQILRYAQFRHQR